MSEILCGNKHAMTDTRCIRLKSHIGDCWGPWHRDPMRPGYLCRTEFAHPASNLPGDHRAYRERYVKELTTHAR